MLNNLSLSSIHLKIHKLKQDNKKNNPIKFEFSLSKIINYHIDFMSSTVKSNFFTN